MENKYFTTASVVSSDRVLYTPSSFARSALLYLQEIGTLQALRAHTSSRQGLQSCLFFTVSAGEGSLSYDGREYGLKPGDCVFIDCRKPYSHTTGENLWTLRWCHFYGPTVSNIYEKYVERGGRPVFRPPEISPFLEVLDGLYGLASGSDFIRDMRINEALNRLCTLVMAESWHPEESPRAVKKRSVLDVKDYLDRNYRSRITLEELSARFFIDKYYLVKVFKEQFGCSINTYLLDLRITRAKQLLRFSDRSLEEIGEECGLGSPQYFSRQFKKVEGISPSRYRSQW